MKSATSAFVGTRPAILLVGYLAVFTVGYREGGAPWKLVEDNEFLNLQARWDVGWYLGVAIDGYSYVPNRPLDQQNIVFFPAYPLLMRVAGRLLGGASTAFALGGTLISLAAFFGALVYLYRLAREMLGDDGEASAAVWLLATFPFALFFSAVYTESLFLLGAVGAFYHFRHGEFVRRRSLGAARRADAASRMFRLGAARDSGHRTAVARVAGRRAPAAIACPRRACEN